MAIAVDTTGGSGTNTFSYTVTGSNACILVEFYGPLTDTATAISWNGNSLTLLGKQTNTGRWYYFYGGLVSAGTGNVVITTGGGDFIWCNVVSYTGVGVLGTGTNHTASATTSFTMTRTTTADNSWLIGCLINNATGSAISAGTGTTIRKNSAGDPGIAIVDKNGPTTPAGSASVNVTGSNLNWFGTTTILEPLAASTGITHKLTLLGVGA